ncbi:Bromodomain adjacent to zinc finger domain protein 2B [Manis javanica]|nr:Bromodomain adjacent to zinc finger domain protein 2B [Manis javanica]
MLIGREGRQSGAGSHWAQIADLGREAAPAPTDLRWRDRSGPRFRGEDSDGSAGWKEKEIRRQQAVLLKHQEVERHRLDMDDPCRHGNSPQHQNERRLIPTLMKWKLI